MDQKVAELLKLDTSDERFIKDITDSEFFGYPIAPIIQAEQDLVNPEKKSIAYFSMEYGLAPSIYHEFKSACPVDEANMIRNHEVFSNLTQMDYFNYLPVEKILDLPIYSGGLGVLAGDSLKSAADLSTSLVGVGILWHKGYFKQKFWFRGGGQFPEELSWDPESYPGLVPLDESVTIELCGAPLHLKLWKYYVYSYDLKSVVPLVLLDANVEDNPEYLAELTDQLYRSNNSWIKLSQRMILGIGGIRALEKLGYNVGKYHMNEGHAAFAFVEKASKIDPEQLKKDFAYTCHTPVEAGHDRFNLQELEAALGPERSAIVHRYGLDQKWPNTANLTLLAMNASSHVNGVSQKHGEVTRIQFPSHRDKIVSITNGIHSFTWMSKPIKDLLLNYKEVLGDFEADPTLLANIVKLKGDPDFRRKLVEAHLHNKSALAEYLKAWFFKPDVFTIAWARRFANYKRPTLLFQDMNRIVSMAKNIGQVQIIIAGKAHPQDTHAAGFMDEMMEKINTLGGQKKILRICFLENYDTYFANLLTSSSDVWLNTPLPPFEASGTSGMKAIVNGVLQLSTLDGWVVECADKGIGSIFGYVPNEGEIGSEGDLKMKEDSIALYDSLEGMMREYYDLTNHKVKVETSPWVDKMINCIEQSAFFSTHRMIREYKDLIWDK